MSNREDDQTRTIRSRRIPSARRSGEAGRIQSQRASTRAALSGRILALALGASALSACSFFQSPPSPRGSLIEPDDYNQLKPGSSNRADAIDLLGSPTTKATFDDNTWIYISMMTVPEPASFPRITKQQVVVLNFDQGGTLRSIRALGLKDAKKAGMVGDVTPTPGTKVNILQQILGNVGRYNPMSGMGSTFGGSTGPMGSNNGPGHGGSGNTLP